MDSTKEFKRWHVNTEEANQLAGWLRRNGIENNADLVESLIEDRDAYLDEVQRTNENEARIMADLIATREECDRLRSELDRLRSAPVAVEVPELTERDEELLRCVERALDKSPSMFDGYMGDGMRAWEASIALDSAIRVGRAIPTSRILKDGEIHGTPEDIAAICEGAGWLWMHSPIGDKKTLLEFMTDALRSKEGEA